MFNTIENEGEGKTKKISWRAHDHHKNEKYNIIKVYVRLIYLYLYIYRQIEKDIVKEANKDIL